MSRPPNSLTDVFKFIDMRGGDETLCWPWTGATSGRDADRPYFSVEGKKLLAYRVVYELVHGDPGHLQVRHRCDNSLCCNPHHLELGTNSENALDNVIRDRTGLPVAAVREIKELLSENVDGRTQDEIARLVSSRHGVRVARSTVAHIARGSRRSVQGQMTQQEVEEARERGEHVRRSPHTAD